MYNFFTVCKYDKSKYLIESYLSIKKFYKEVNYSVVIPDYEVYKFRKLFEKNNIKDINIVLESTYLPLEKFKEIYINNLFDLNLSSNEGSELLPWYYQQALKLSFCFDRSIKGKIVMIDADTILLRKVKFFDNNKSTIFLSSYERNIFYKLICEDIFQEKFKNWISSTVQLFSITSEERIFLKSKLNSYLPKSKNQSNGEWVSNIILRSVLIRYKNINGSFISEQDLIATSNSINGSDKYLKIKFLRSGVIGELNKFQIKIAAKLNFYYLTYEKWIMKKERINNLDFLLIIFINTPFFHRKLKKIQSLLK